MDEELRKYLDGMMAQINDKFEQMLDEMGTLRTDFQNTKGFLLEDAIVMGRRSLSIEQRLTKLEEELRRGKPL